MNGVRVEIGRSVSTARVTLPRHCEVAGKCGVRFLPVFYSLCLCFPPRVCLLLSECFPLCLGVCRSLRLQLCAFSFLWLLRMFSNIFVPLSFGLISLWLYSLLNCFLLHRFLLFLSPLCISDQIWLLPFNLYNIFQFTCPAETDHQL